MLAADWPFLQRAFFAAAMLLWPILLFGAPAYFSDSASYYNGGRTAVAIILDRLQSLTEHDALRQASAEVAKDVATVEGAKGSRSVLYSVAAYLLSGPGTSMTLLAAVQALATGWVVSITAQLAGIHRWSGFMALTCVVAFATPAAVFVCYIVPDIFAALLIAALVTLTVAFERLSTALRISLAAIAAFAVTSHNSHPPVAAGLLFLGTVAVVLQRKWDIEAAHRIAWLLAPLVLGTLATLMTSFIGFGTLSLAPKRYPLTLARSIEDGPARWYLAKHCGEQRYTVCEVFGPSMPENMNDFLWKNGLTGRATPEQMERIRAEESIIVTAAALEYPLTQAKIIAVNVAAQIAHIGLGDVGFNQVLELDKRGKLLTVETSPPRRTVLALVEWLSAATALGAMLWVVWTARRLRSCERVCAALLVAGLLGNAAVCAIFSAVADRYQARVVWLLPLLALAILIGSVEREGRQSGD